MKKRSSNIILFGAMLAVGILVALAVMGGSPAIPGAPRAGVSSGETQLVKLTMSGYTYVMQPSILEQGVPVRMEVDLSTVRGCMRSIQIPAFGVSTVVGTGDDVIDFTPTKAGTFNIACGMNMGKGTFTVEARDGSASGYVEPAPAAASGCGGGCGGAKAGGVASCH